MPIPRQLWFAATVILLCLPIFAAAQNQDESGDALPKNAVARFGSTRLRAGGMVGGVAFSPKGKQIAYGSYDYQWRIADLENGKTLHQRSQNGWVLDVAYSHDGGRLALVGSGRVSIVDADTGVVVADHKVDEKLIFTSVAFSPDNKQLVVGNIDASISIFDAETLMLKKSLNVHTERVNDLEFSPDGKRLASVANDRTARIFEVASWKELKRINLKSPSRAVAWVQKGKKIALGAGDNQLFFFDAATGQLSGQLKGHRSSISSMATSRDGKTLVSGCSGQTLCTWDANTGKLLKQIQVRSNEISALSVSPDNKTIATGHRHSVVRLFELASLKEIQVAPSGYNSVCLALAYSAATDHLAMGFGDGTIAIRHVASKKEVLRWEAHTDAIQDLVFKKDGKTLISASDDQSVRLWDVNNAAEIVSLRGHKNRINSVAINSSETMMATCSADKTVLLWDLKDYSTKRTFAGSDGFRRVRFSPDGKWIAFGGAGREGQVVVVDANTGEQRFRSNIENPSSILNLVFSKDGNHLFMQNYNQFVFDFDLVEKSSRTVTQSKRYSNNALALSPNGRILMFTTTNRALHFHDASTHQQISNASSGHVGWIRAAEFSSDGRYLFTACEDTTVLVHSLQRILPKVSTVARASAEANVTMPVAEASLDRNRDTPINPLLLEP